MNPSRVFGTCSAVFALVVCGVGVASVARAQDAPPDTTDVRSAGPDPIQLELGPLELRRDPSARVLLIEREPRLEPFAYAARSVVWPGWGQDALGETNKGIAYGSIFGVSIPLSAGWVPVPFVEDEDFSQTVGFALWATVAVIAAVDAFRGAERVNRENGYDLQDRLDDQLGAGSARGAAPWIVRLVVFRGDF